MRSHTHTHIHTHSPMDQGTSRRPMTMVMLQANGWQPKKGHTKRPAVKAASGWEDNLELGPSQPPKKKKKGEQPADGTAAAVGTRIPENMRRHAGQLHGQPVVCDTDSSGTRRCMQLRDHRGSIPGHDGPQHRSHSNLHRLEHTQVPTVRRLRKCTCLIRDRRSD